MGDGLDCVVETVAVLMQVRPRGQALRLCRHLFLRGSRRKRILVQCAARALSRPSGRPAPRACVGFAQVSVHRRWSSGLGGSGAGQAKWVM